MIRIWFKWLDLKTPLLAGFEAPDDTGGAPPVAQCDSVDLQGGHACFQEMFSTGVDCGDMFCTRRDGKHCVD